MSILKIKNDNDEWESVPVIKGEKGDTGNTGPQGPKGETGDTGATGPAGQNGISPIVTTSKSGKTTTITIVDAEGTKTAEILDGVDGQGSGDMLTSVYDTNHNGIVDNAEAVNGHTVGVDVPSNAVFTDTTYTAGTGIDITNNVISNTQTSAAWGNITGTLSSQTDLNTALGSKADSSSLATVATSGSYTDLSNVPTIPAATYLGKVSDYSSSTPLNITNLGIGLYSLHIDSTNSWLYLEATYKGNNVTGYFYNYSGRRGLQNDALYLRIHKKITDDLSSGTVIGRIYFTSTNDSTRNLTYFYKDVKITTTSVDTSSGSYYEINAVSTDGAQTISGKKTFSTLPESSVVPTSNDQLVNKAYVDGLTPTETDPVFSASAASGITSTDITNWNNKTSNTGTVTSIETSGAITGGTITTNGTISHSTSAGYKHIPSGGDIGDYLRNTSSGTAVWATPDTSISSSASYYSIPSSKAVLTKTTWKLIDNKTGTTSINLPSEGVEEIMCIVKIQGNDNVQISLIIPYAHLTTSNQGFNSGYYGAGQGTSAYCRVTASTASVAINQAYLNANNATSSSILYVYYR